MLSCKTRLEFLKSIGSAGAVFAGAAGASPRCKRGHDVMIPACSDAGAAHLTHGYPDECHAFTIFADSLAARAWGHGWYAQPPIVSDRNAIVVDFVSRQEQDAEASLEGGWNGAWEFPMGTVNTVAARVETNAQNARIARHLALIGTGMRQAAFHRDVIEPLLDERSCRNASCAICAARPQRGIAGVFHVLATGMRQSVVQLFSQWEPSNALREALRHDGIDIVHHRLSSIPGDDLAANSAYHLWDGTPLQAERFRKTIWKPAWRGA